MNEREKILVIRNDKIGDFMLSWPSFALLKNQYPDTEITALVPSYTAQLAEQCQWIDKILIDKRESTFLKDIISLRNKIKKNDYDVAISLFSEARTAIALWLAGVKTRIGPATKLAQLFINRKLQQNRSQSKKPEYEYNLDLIKYFFLLRNQVPSKYQHTPFLTFRDNETQQLKRNLLNKHPISDDMSVIMIHPGTGGSAINLTLEHYAELANCIADLNSVYFIITAGPGESDTAEQLSKLINAAHHIHYSEGNIIDFCKLISIMDIFISGSTGPLHIAGALNIRTVAFYPAKRSATLLRWQTLNDNDKRLSFTINNELNKEKIDIDITNVCKSVCDKYLNK